MPDDPYIRSSPNVTESLDIHGITLSRFISSVFRPCTPRISFCSAGGLCKSKETRHPRQKGAAQNSNHVTVEPLQNKESKQTNKKLTVNAWMKARWEPRERFHHPNLWLLWWVQAAIQHQTLEDVLWCQGLKWWIRLQVNFCNMGNATCRGRLR